MDQNLIDKFLKELSAHIKLLDRDYESRKKLYDVDKFLRANFSATSTDVYSSLVDLATARCQERGETLSEKNTFESVAVECYEILKFFEPNTSITLDELKEATPNWENVVKADNWFRSKYDELIDMLNESRTEIYPYIEEKIEATELELKVVYITCGSFCTIKTSAWVYF
jgi:hypothetical protein